VQYREKSSAFKETWHFAQAVQELKAFSWDGMYEELSRSVVRLESA
jgi:hypothetical protein